MAIDLITLQYFNDMYPNTDGNLNVKISSLINAYSLLFEKFAHRKTKIDIYTKQIDVQPLTSYISLDAYPIQSGVVQVWNDRDREFGSGTIIDPSDFYVDLENGGIQFDGNLTPGPGALKVSWKGGMADIASGVGSGVVGFINDFPNVANALRMQVNYEMSRRREPGAVTSSVAGESVSSVGEFNLLSVVKMVWNSEKRPVF